VFAKNPRAFILVATGLCLASLAAMAFWLESRRVPSTATIAFIPKAPGTMLWEAERSGATAAAEAIKCHLYWNAPNSETDSAGQITLIDKVVSGKYQGLVVAPDHVFALLSPLRRALAAGLPW
jgi:ABC-type sugar transport system substrate-binding protein